MCALRHDELSTFDIGADLSDTQWRAVFRQLIALGFLETDSAYGSLKLTLASRGVLKREVTVSFREEAARPRKRKRGGKSAVGLGQQGAPSSPLLIALRDWRLTTAREHGVPAYVVFHDATLEAIAEVRPRTIGDLRTISGIGATKLQRYGTALLELCAES